MSDAIALIIVWGAFFGVAALGFSGFCWFAYHLFNALRNINPEYKWRRMFRPSYMNTEDVFIRDGQSSVWKAALGLLVFVLCLKAIEYFAT